MPEQQKNINIKMTDEVMKGSYANNMFVSHSKEEFILDFVNISFFPPPGQGIATAKVITSPAHFKRMVAALNDNLKKFEEQFGKIELGKSSDASAASASTDRPFGFGK